jgi:hypothetical protein
VQDHQFLISHPPLLEAGPLPADLASYVSESPEAEENQDRDDAKESEEDTSSMTSPPSALSEETGVDKKRKRVDVMGMTYGACHVLSYLLAGVLGVSTAQRQEDRLRPKDWLRQQPANDPTVEGRSRVMKTKAHHRLFCRKWAGPDKSGRGKGWE